MKERLENIRKNGLEKIELTKNLEELQEVRKDLTGKKSELSDVMKSFGELSIDMKKEIFLHKN